MRQRALALHELAGVRLLLWVVVGQDELGGSLAWNLEALDDIDALLKEADAQQVVLEKEAVSMKRKGACVTH